MNKLFPQQVVLGWKYKFYYYKIQQHYGLTGEWKADVSIKLAAS